MLVVLDILDSLKQILERMLFEVASHRGVTDEYVFCQSVGWLFSQYKATQRSLFSQWTGMIRATEIALSRVLGQAFSGKKINLPELPSWEQISGEKARKGLEQKRPWQSKFEQANFPQEDANGDAG